MDIFDLSAKLTLDSSQYEKGIDSSKKSANNWSSNLKTAGKVAAGAVTAVASAVTAVTATFAEGIKQTAQYGDNIDKMSQKMGISAKAYQEWDFVMQHCGTSIDSLKSSMKTLANAAESGNDSFAKIGITQKEIANMSQEELFSATISGLQKVEDTTQRTYLAGQLLGKGATELGALLNMTAEETEELKNQLGEIGGLMSDKTVKAAAAFQDSLQNLQTSFTGIKNKLFGEFMPAVTTAMDGITMIFSGDTTKGLEKISKGVDDFIAKLNDILPEVIKIGGNIIVSLAKAIVDNLPKLMDSAVEIVFQLVNSIVKMLPTVVESGFDILMSVVNGITEAIPELIPAVADVILKIVEELTKPDTLKMLLKSALELVIALAQGLVDSLPTLIDAVFVLIDNMVQFLIEPDNLEMLIQSAIKMVGAIISGLIKAIPQLLEGVGKLIYNILFKIDNSKDDISKSGQGIVSNLIKGIGSFVDKIVAAGGKIIDKFKSGLGIDKAFNWGVDLIKNFIAGIKKKFDDLKNTVSNVAGTVKDYLGFSEPEKGPLSNFHTYAPDMMNLFIKGIKDNEGKLTAQIEKTFNFGEIGSISSNLDSSFTNSIVSRETNTGLISMLINILSGVGLYLDSGELVGHLALKINQELGTLVSLQARGI